jgi:hypothetical protein
LAHSLGRKVDVLRGSPLGLLDEPVEEHHTAVIDAEQYSGDASVETRSNFPQAAAKRSAGRHTDRPAEAIWEAMYQF